MQTAHDAMAEKIHNSNQELRAALTRAQAEIDAGIRDTMWKIRLLFGGVSLVSILCIKYSPCSTNIC